MYLRFHYLLLLLLLLFIVNKMVQAHLLVKLDNMNKHLIRRNK